jgi:RsiW-degrading membrane proteinase PrsW (M82 family)
MKTEQSFTQTEGHHLSWLRVFVIGLLLFIAGLAVLILSANPNLFPTVVMIGNFLIPVTFVAFFYEHRHLSRLSLPTTALSFFYGGVLGVLASSLLEPIFVRQLNIVTVFVVGIIEEFAKILGVLVIARRHKHDSEMDGLVLGAAAGMGFAALESNGYVFSTFLASGGSLTAAVAITLLRGILSPVGHGTWTAILAAVLFRESESKHFRINGKVVGAYLTVVLLHGLWDGLPGFVAAIFTPGLDVFVAQALVGATGLIILWRLWVESKRRQLMAQVVSIVHLDGKKPEEELEEEEPEVWYER